MITVLPILFLFLFLFGPWMWFVIQYTISSNRTQFLEASDIWGARNDKKDLDVQSKLDCIINHHRSKQPENRKFSSYLRDLQADMDVYQYTNSNPEFRQYLYWKTHIASHGDDSD